MTAPEASEGPPRRRRWLRRSGYALCIFFTALVVIVGGAYVYLMSPAGEAQLKRRALAAANDALAGTVDAEAVELSGEWVTLRNAKLFDPEGNLVAEVEELTVKASLSALLDDRIHIDVARMKRPRLYLEVGDAGLNLTRAVAAKVKKAEADGGTPGKLELSVGELELTDGYLRLRQEDRLPKETIAEGLTVTGRGTYAARGRRFDGELSLKGAFQAPFEAPLSLQLTANGAQGGMSLKATGDVAGLLLGLDGTLLAGGDAEVQRMELTVPPQLARAVLGDWPLQLPVAVKGTVQKRGPFSDMKLSLSSGKARATVDATVDVASFTKNRLALHLSGVDLSELFLDRPPSDLGLTLFAEGGGTSLRKLSGNAKLSLPAGSYNGGAVGPLTLTAQVKDGVFEVGPFEATLPGLKLSLSGQGTPERLIADGRIEASNLGALTAALDPLLKTRVPKLSGQGALTFHAEGPPTHPAVTVDADFPSFAYDQHRIRGLSLSATLPDVTRPLEATGKLSVAHATLGGQRFEALEADVTTRGRKLTADVSTKGMAEVSVHLQGVLDADASGVALTELELRYPEATWQLVAPAKVRVDHGFSADELTLSSGTQRLVFRGKVGEGRVQAELEAHRVELAVLPRAFVPEALGLGGVLNATVAAEGRLKRPTLQVLAQVGGLSVMGHRDIHAALEARYADGRVRGAVDVEAFGAFLFLDADAPVDTLLERRDVPLSVTATLSKADAARLLRELGVEAVPVSGELDATVEVTGTAKSPEVRVTVNGRQVTYETLPPANFALVLSTNLDRTLYGQLQLDALGGRSSVLLQTPLTLDGLWKKPPRGKEWLSLPLSVDLALDEVSLAPLHASGLLPPDLRGAISARGKLQGTAKAPLGELTVEWLNASFAKGAPLDLRLFAQAEQSRMVVALKAKQADRTLLELEASAAASWERLQVEDSVVRTPISLRARAGTLSLSELKRLLPEGTIQEDPGEELSGNVTVELEGSGTAMAPKLRLRALLDGVGLGALAVGKGEVKLDYEKGRPVFDVSMTNPDGGTLRLSGEARMDLSYPAVKTVSFLEAPVTGEISAKNFELAFLSNFTPLVRSLGGKLEAQALVNGPLGAPEIEGSIEWKQGVLGLIGYGEYHDIHLLLQATNQRLSLKELTLSAGNGRLSFEASADRREKGYVMEASGQLTNFPIVTNDQLRAIVSMRTTARGEVTAKAVNIAGSDGGATAGEAQGPPGSRPAGRRAAGEERRAVARTEKTEAGPHPRARDEGRGLRRLGGRGVRRAERPHLFGGDQRAPESLGTRRGRAG